MRQQAPLPDPFIRLNVYYFESRPGVQEHVPASFSVAVEREEGNEYVIGIYLSATAVVCPFVNLTQHGRLERFIIRVDTNDNITIMDANPLNMRFHRRYATQQNIHRAVSQITLGEIVIQIQNPPVPAPAPRPRESHGSSKVHPYPF